MSTEPELEVLRRPIVEKAFGISRSTLYGRTTPGSKQFVEGFPKPTKDHGVSGFFKHEIQAYLKLLASRR